MAASVFKPLFFENAILPHCYWRCSVNGKQSRELELEIPLVIKISNEAASNDWRPLNLCTKTGPNTISKLEPCYSSEILSIFEISGFSLTTSNTGKPLITTTVISGYWMGPDDEDECGYIEALVQRIN